MIIKPIVIIFLYDKVMFSFFKSSAFAKRADNNYTEVFIMNKVLKGLLLAGLAVSIGTTTMAVSEVSVEAAKPNTSVTVNTARINELIAEKQTIIARKKVSRDKQEQKALGMRIGQIEKEISLLKKGQMVESKPGIEIPVENNNTSQAEIQDLISQKMAIIEKKKVSRDKNEQKALAKEIKEIEKAIKNLKKSL